MRGIFFRLRAARLIRISLVGRLADRSARIRYFFFGDYQGTRTTQGVDTGQIPVPSAQDRTGNLLDQAGSLTTDAQGNLIRRR